MEEVNSVLKTAKKVVIESDKVCPNCGKKMLVRTSRYGNQFLGCSGYPECKTIISLENMSELENSSEGGNGEIAQEQIVEEKCEKCGGEMVLKTGPYGKYIECKECNARKRYIRSTGVKCPKCGQGEIVEKKSKSGKIFFGCNKYPDCDFALWDEPTGEHCPDCGELIVKRNTKNGTVESCSNRKCGYKKFVEKLSTEE